MHLYNCTRYPLTLPVNHYVCLSDSKQKPRLQFLCLHTVFRILSKVQCKTGSKPQTDPLRETLRYHTHGPIPCTTVLETYGHGPILSTICIRNPPTPQTNPLLETRNPPIPLTRTNPPLPHVLLALLETTDTTDPPLLDTDTGTPGHGPILNPLLPLALLETTASTDPPRYRYRPILNPPLPLTLLETTDSTDQSGCRIRRPIGGMAWWHMVLLVAT